MTAMYLGGKRKGRRPSSSKKGKKRGKGSKRNSKTQRASNFTKRKSRKSKTKTMKKNNMLNIKINRSDSMSKVHSYEQKQLFIDNGSIKDYYYYEQHNDEPPIFLYKDLKNE